MLPMARSLGKEKIARLKAEERRRRRNAAVVIQANYRARFYRAKYVRMMQHKRPSD